MKKLIVILLGIALFSGCIQEELKWTIRDVLERPELYEGRDITLEGEYMGWVAGCASTGPPVTRSDWQLRDETGCIYVTAFFPELDPLQDAGTEVRVKGVVRVNDIGIPYIEAYGVMVFAQVGDNETSDIDDIFSEPGVDITPPSLPL